MCSPCPYEQTGRAGSVIPAMRVKAAHVLYQHGRISRLQKRFSVSFVPSHVVHAEAVHEVHGNVVEFELRRQHGPIVERSLASLRLIVVEPATILVTRAALI